MKPLPPDPRLADAHRQAIAKLEFLAGRWAGQGWIATGPGEPRRFQQTETIALKQDGPARGPATVRFTVCLNEKGQWHETGEVVMPGQPPRQFFEMTLDRQP